MSREEELLSRIGRLEEQLAYSNKQLEDFLYAISHDLKGPLRAIMSSSMIVIEDYGDRLGPGGRAELERGSTAARKIAALIEEVLKLSRLSREAMNQQPVDLSEAANEVAERYSGQGSVDVQSEMSCFADPRNVRMILSLLVDNAVKFSPKDRPTKVEIGEEDGVFFVRDDGIGFEQEQEARIFRPFEKINGDDYPGHGMGLTTARLLVQRNGGRLWGEGRLSEGATFRFTLPRGAEG